MPGAYTHLTMVSLLGSGNELLGVGDCTKEELAPLLNYTKYMELGAVSPDYPYLHLFSLQKKKSARWADAMHYSKVGERIRIGIEEVNRLDNTDKIKALCWLMGFTSHVITDVTIHPVVQLKVGPYEKNKTAHRICEMNQDIYIYEKLGNGILTKNHLQTGIRTCADENNTNKIDPVIHKIWTSMLQKSAPQMFTNSPPAIDDWHKSFNRVVEKTAPTHGLFCWSRHMLDAVGVLYPETHDAEYIEHLQTPDDKSMHYDAIFEKAEKNVKYYWAILLQACIKQKSIDTNCFLDWNLDTGQDEHGKITFWEA